MVILIAGYDTTATTLSWVCYELAKNPEVQDKLRQEVDDIVEQSDADDLNYDEVQKMPYMDQVFCESLRLHTPIPMLQRSTLKEYTFSAHNLTIKPGVPVWVNIPAIHMDPKHYKKPKVYDPEHFSKEAKAERNP